MKPISSELWEQYRKTHSPGCSVFLGPVYAPDEKYHCAVCDCGAPTDMLVDSESVSAISPSVAKKFGDFDVVHTNTNLYMSDEPPAEFTHHFYLDNKGDGDLAEGRQGEWMHTSLGGRFYPADPRESEIFISDIANGLSLDCRYGGQGRVDKFYSVAEHSVLMAQYAAKELCWPSDALKCILLHDAAEAYLNDLPRAVKHAVGASYDLLEERIQTLVYRKYGLTARANALASQIKEIDCRIVPLEKAAIMAHPQPWEYDKFQSLLGVAIQCWEPKIAKAKFLNAWCRATPGLFAEDIVYD